MVFGQIQTTLNFYFYGKKHFTATGYARNMKRYTQPKLVDDADMSGRVIMVTGSNTGIGREIATWAAKKNATVFMVCRTPSRAEKARDEIIKESGNEKVVFLQADVGLEADVRRMWAEFLAHELAKGDREEKGAEARLDGLVCNAGALLSERTLTSEGQETTFAAHLLFGTHLLGDLAMPTLVESGDSRLVVVSSGGMYNYALPSWEVLSGTHETSVKDYDGQKAYAYAKRGQVLLAERWALDYPNVAITTAHVGWSNSEGVQTAYGDQASNLEPMRTCWEGAEGICWLLACKKSDIQSGAFYLDREPQPKHIAGAFYYEGTATKNTTDEVDMFYENCKRWASANTKENHMDIWRPTPERTALKLKAREESSKAKATEKAFDLQKFMIKWHVLAHKPIMAVSEHLLANPYEHYEWSESAGVVRVRFTSTSMDSQESQLALMHGTVRNAPTNSIWSLNPKILFYLPLNLEYVMLHVAEDMSWCLVGTPNRNNAWIMTANRPNTKDSQPWPSTCGNTYRQQQGCQGFSGAIVDCARTEKVLPVHTGSGIDYTDDQSPRLTVEEETEILKQGVRIAEEQGYDTSEIRMACWRNDIP